MSRKISLPQRFVSRSAKNFQHKARKTIVILSREQMIGLRKM